MSQQRSQLQVLTRRRMTGGGKRRARGGMRPVVPVDTLVHRTDGWWDDMEADILSALGHGGKSPAELGDTLGMSEHAVTSLLYMLVLDGRVRIQAATLAVGAESLGAPRASGA